MLGSAGLSALSLRSAFIQRGLSERRCFVLWLLLSCSPFRLLVTNTHTHTPAMPLNLIPPRTHAHDHIQTSDPSVPLLPRWPFPPIQHFWDLPGKRSNCPPPLPRPSLFLPLDLFSFSCFEDRGRKKIPSSSLRRHGCSLSYSFSDSFPHNLQQQRSPPFLLSLLLHMTFSKCSCTLAPSTDSDRVGGWICTCCRF